MRATFLIILALALGGWAFWWGVRRHPHAPPMRPAKLVVSGDTAGWITPCGCIANQSGGLLRRGTYVRELRAAADVIYADVGGSPAGVGPYQQAKFEAIISGEMMMGVAMHNIGGPEAMLGPSYLRDIAARLKAPLISANTRDAAGHSIAEPVRIVNAGGRHIAFVGVLSQDFATDQVRVSEPRQAVLSAVETIKGRYDSLIVLAYVPERELNQLAADLPEADAIVGGHTSQAIAPKSAGPALVAAAANKGKFLIQLDVPGKSDSRHWEGTVIEMGPSIADDAAQLANLRQYLHALGDRDFSARESGLVAQLPPDVPADYRVADSGSCRACHREAHESWSASAHSRALHALEPRGFQVDPFCLQCHTTSYGIPGGFDSLKRTADLANVGCESCHGPSLAHARNPKSRTAFAAADQCTRCHDQENSPNFNYPAQWGRIRHGTVKAPAGQVRS